MVAARREDAYDLDSLKRGLESIKVNIKALEEGLENEKQKKNEYERHILEAEAVINIHKRGFGDGSTH